VAIIAFLQPEVDGLNNPESQGNGLSVVEGELVDGKHV